MKEFGWSIEYVLSLTFPVFFDLFNLIHRVRLDAAIDEFYTPYAAAKFGGKCSKSLFSGRGKIILYDDEENETKEITNKMISKANRKLKRIIKSRQDALKQVAINH